MSTSTRLSLSQRLAFLREGYLVVEGEFCPSMIDDLLDVLDEDDAAGAAPSATGAAAAP